jgi:alcohol dehydrogenase class IV
VTDGVPECRAGAVGDLARFLEASPSATVLVTGGDSYRASGAAAAIEPALEGHDVRRYAGTRTNPTDEDVSGLVDLLRATSPSVLVAVGGGSVIDVAKAARGLTRAEDVRAAIIGGDVAADASTTLVAVPTTAGSGSEATHFAAIYVDGVKRSVAHPSLRPERVVLDPELSRRCRRD